MLGVLAYMSHIETARLMAFSENAIVLDSAEVQHLRNCEECEDLLRIFVRQFNLTREMLQTNNQPAMPPFKATA